MWPGRTLGRCLVILFGLKDPNPLSDSVNYPQVSVGDRTGPTMQMENNWSRPCGHLRPGLRHQLHLPSSDSGLVMREVGALSRDNQGEKEEQPMELPGSSGHLAGGRGHVQSPVSTPRQVSEQVTTPSPQWLRSLRSCTQFCHSVLTRAWVSSRPGHAEPRFS